MGVFESLKEIANIVQKADNIELYKELINVQNEIYSLVSENQKLRDQNSDLIKKLTISGELEFIENAYWRGKEGPFCTNCWDTEKKLIHLHTNNRSSGTCPNCKNSVTFNLELTKRLAKETMEKFLK